MYKVFYNDKLIDIRNYEEVPYRSDQRSELLYAAPDKMLRKLRDFINQDKLKELCIIHDDPVAVMREIQSGYPVIQAAGGLVQHNDGRILFIFRKGKWDLPKGKIDEGETPEIAAIREIREETSIAGLTFQSTLPTTYHILERDGKWYCKVTYWFSFRTGSVEILVPALAEGITDVRWIRKEDVHRLFGNIYHSLYEVILSAWPDLH